VGATTLRPSKYLGSGYHGGFVVDGSDGGTPGFAGKARGVLAGLGLVAVLKSMEKRAEDEDEPGLLIQSHRVDKLVELAFELVTNDRPNEDAVRRLLQAAGRHRGDLKKAAAQVRFGGHAKFDRRVDRANRLLLAAFTGEPVRPIPPEQDEFFTRVDDLMSVPVEEAWPTLVRLQPGLADLETRFAPRPVRESERDPLWDELIGALEPVVGHDAQSDDPLVRSDPAWNVARLFLAVRVGLLDEVDYT
jgi:hypothetical protein